MKPCAKNRKSLALLSLDELGGEPARELRTHLEMCEGCRRYYREISTVTAGLSALESNPDIRASAAFHRRVVGALRTETPARKQSLLELLGFGFANGRTAWVATGALVVLVAALAISMSGPRRAPLPGPIMATGVPAAGFSADLSPTVANYQMVADRSLDKLDDLLTRQGDRNSAPAPVYTASDFARLSLAN
jgi:hypothetical protein